MQYIPVTTAGDVNLNNYLTLKNIKATKFLIIVLILLPLSIMSYFFLFEQINEEREAEVTKNAQIADLLPVI